MAILTQTKAAVDQQFGPPTMADNLIGGDDFFKREEAYQYSVGDLQVIVGFYSGIGRYVAFTKGMLDPQQFASEDVQSSLMLIAPPSQWKSSADQTPAPAPAGGAKPSTPPPAHVIGSVGADVTYQCTIKDSAGNDVSVLAWHRSDKAYVFAYCPLMMPPQPAIAASPAVIDPNFEQS